MRSGLDRLVSWTALVLALFLLVAGGLLVWANQFIGDQVNKQLSMQDITMPSGDAIKALPSADKKELEPYADSKLDSGPEAKAFADHYILVHMNEASGGKTYEEVSGEFISMSPQQQASAEGQQLGQLRQTLFMGDTLRGLLLYGYAFATMGTIAGYAAIASFVSALLLIALALLGLRHASRTDTDTDTGTGGARHA